MRGIGIAASVLIGLVAALGIADAIVSQRTADVVRAYADGNATMEDARAVDALAVMVAIPALLVNIAAGVTFIVWIYRSRRNAERLTYAVEHRHGRGWVIGSWITPIVGWWFPYQIVQDIWRSFEPAQQDRPLQARDKNGFILAWWLGFLLMSWGDRLVMRLVLREDADLDTVATWTWVTTVVTVVAAAMAVALVKRLTDLQDRTRPQEFSGPVQVHVPGA
ncbi:MAG TPA: DUF4328 domain-containing protein [Lentzea sp.]